MNNKNKILLVDGHLLLFQMFYGMPSRIVGKNGKSYQCKTLTGEAIFNCLNIEPFIGLLPVLIQKKLQEIENGTNT